MYTIKAAAELTGLTAGALRAWEQRYGIGCSSRTESGYRIYDQAAISEIQHMQRLVAEGWTHTAAAEEIVNKRGQTVSTAEQSSEFLGNYLDDLFFEAALQLDVEKLNYVLDRAFASGSFEFVIDNWVSRILRKVGELWVAGKMDIAGEHFISSALMRRISIVFDNSGSSDSRRNILVGTPAGSFHEIGALALATAIRRRGVGVMYVGCNVPAESWVEAAERNKVDGIALSVVMPQDAETAQKCISLIKSNLPKIKVFAGGPSAMLTKNADLNLTESIKNSSKKIAESLA